MPLIDTDCDALRALIRSAIADDEQAEVDLRLQTPAITNYTIPIRERLRAALALLPEPAMAGGGE